MPNITQENITPNMALLTADITPHGAKLVMDFIAVLARIEQGEGTESQKATMREIGLLLQRQALEDMGVTNENV